MSTIRATEKTAIIGTIDPDAYAANTYPTDVIDMKDFERVIFDVLVGEITATGTVDFSVYGDVASGGAFATLITGKAITQLTAAGTDSDKQVRVEVTAAEVKAQGLRYLRGSLVVAVAACDAAVIVTGHDARFQPVSGYNLASVDEIVA